MGHWKLGRCCQVFPCSFLKFCYLTFSIKCLCGDPLPHIVSVMFKSHGEYKMAATGISTVFIFLSFFLVSIKSLHFSKPALRETGTGG